MRINGGGSAINPVVVNGQNKRSLRNVGKYFACGFTKNIPSRTEFMAHFTALFTGVQSLKSRERILLFARET